MTETMIEQLETGESMFVHTARDIDTAARS